jgi:signal transduction histidine kinase
MPLSIRLLILITAFILQHTRYCSAQSITRYNTFSYNVNEGLLQSTIKDIAFDKNNFCWLSFPNGIQKFDGKNFTTVPVQPGLPDDKLCRLFQCANGDLLISHQQGISKYEITGNRFVQVYSNGIGEKSPVDFIGQDEQIIYFHSTTGTIRGMSYPGYKIVSETKTGFPDYSSNSDYQPWFSDNIINHKVAFHINNSLCLWDLKAGKLVSESPAIPDKSPYFFLHLKTENEVLYYNYKENNALQLYNFAINTHRSLVIKGKDDKQIDRCIIFPWQNKILISFSNRLYETDESLQVLKTELVNFQNQPVTGNFSIAQIKQDNFGNLLLRTITNGIRKIIRNNYPVKYFGTEKKEQNFIISIFPDKKNNRILAGTSGNGLLVFDTLQRLVKHIETFPGRNNPALINTILKMNDGSYLLFAHGEKQVWRLSDNLLQLKPIVISTSLPPGKSGINYFGNPLFQNEQEAIVQSQNRLYRTNLKNHTITEHQFAAGYIMSGHLYNNTIITHGNDELIFLDAATFNEIRKIPFKNTGYVRCFARPALPAGRDAAGIIYIGSNKGIFKIDSMGKILQQLNKEAGLPDECIYAMTFDNDGFLWCSTNKGLLKIHADNSVMQLKKEDGLQENEFNTNAVAKSEDGELFFGGVNGLSSFYPSAISGFEEKINLLVTKIKANNEDVLKDTAAWSIAAIKLPYTRNNLSFDFVAMGTSNLEQYIYQYKMEGVDKEWIQNDGMQTVRYSLPPGKYTFKMYASRFFNKDAAALKEIRIFIQPPFWKAWWFLTGVVLLGIGLLAFAINRYNKNKYQKKLQILEHERRVKAERERMSKDLHDSLGAYANAVLYNTELLEHATDTEKRVGLMKDLKFASKDIITSLRETIWALNKESYTAEDCLLRIRNFIQPFNRYYEQIRLRVEGEAPANVTLDYKKALHLVRIVQEAITNSIKHAGASNITVTSLPLNGQWMLKVNDDGKGFDSVSARESKTGNGLGNMEQRAAEAGFIFVVESRAGSGSLVSITV